MKYEIIWDDFEDGRCGESFSVIAKDPTEAYNLARQEIMDLSDFYKRNGATIECLIDKNGKYHYPDFFLRKVEDKK